MLLALGAGIAAGVSVVTMDPQFWDSSVGRDVWFEADLPRIVDEMTHRWADHSRATVHPLFSLFSVSAVYGLRALSLEPLRSVAALAGITAAAWAVLLYAVLRMIRHRPLEAMLFTLIALTSGAGLFWLSVPETYAAGSATILFALLVAAAAEAQPGRVNQAWFVVASAVSLSVTVTNWIAGILAAGSQHSWRQVLQISVNAFCLVVALWAVQRAIVPNAHFFIGYSNEQRYLLREEAGHTTDVVTVLGAHSIVMPRIATVAKPGRGLLLSVQRSVPGSGGMAGTAAVVLWLVLFGCGLWGLVREAPTSATLRIVGLLAGAQVILHGLYGTETFLYTLNIMPLLVIIASLAVRTPARWPAIVAALLLLVFGAVNNVAGLHQARSFLQVSGMAAASER